MKTAKVAVVKGHTTTFLPVPESILKAAHVRDADFFNVTISPDGTIQYRRVEEDTEP